MKVELERGVWRPMTDADMPAVVSIADRVHVNYPEDDEVLAERLRLYPEGCAILECDGKPAAYAITHPWFYAEPPSLNVSLGALPANPSTYYIHDIALLPEARGSGAASAIVNAIIAHAETTGISNLSLVAVNNSGAFWNRFDFEVTTVPSLDAKLKSYDDAARFMVRQL